MKISRRRRDGSQVRQFISLAKSYYPTYETSFENLLKNSTIAYLSLVSGSVPTGVLISFLPLYLFGISNSEFLAASVASVPALSAILASPIWGALKDRSSRSKPLMLVGVLPYAALSFFLIFTRDVTQIYLAWSAAALLLAATTPVFASFVTAGVERRGASLGLMAASAASGGAIGALVGGVAYQWYDLRTAFLLGGLGSLTAALIILFALKENPQPPDPDPSARRIATLEILSNRRVLMPCISCFSYMVGITAFSSLAAIYIVEVLGGSRFLWGISATFGYVLGAVTIAPTGRLSDRVGRKPIIRAGLLAQIVLFVSFLFFRDPLLVALLYVAPLAYVVCTTITTLVTDVTSERERGKAVGIQNSWLNAGGVAGPLLGGALAQGLGIGVVFPFAIAMVLFSVAWAQLTVAESKPKGGPVKLSVLESRED